MSKIQHQEAERLLSIIWQAKQENRTLTYGLVAGLLGRDPKRGGRAVAAFCDLLDSAAALAGVPALALTVVREASGKINRGAWASPNLPKWLRQRVIDRAEAYKFTHEDYLAIQSALTKLDGFGNRRAWKELNKIFPGDQLYQRLSFGDEEGNEGAKKKSTLMSAQDFKEISVDTETRTLVIYLKKKNYRANFSFDERTRSIKSGFWKPAIRAYERVIIYQGYEDRTFLAEPHRALVWIGDSDGQTQVTKGMLFNAKNVEDPYPTNLSFKELTGLSPPQLGWRYILASKRDLPGRGNNSSASRTDGSVGDSDEGDEDRITMVQKAIWVRRHHHIFKRRLGEVWGDCCAVSTVNEPGLLRASHIRSWADSNSVDRLSRHNGLLLSAHLDALFDRHLITFDENGKIVISTSLSETTRQAYGLSAEMKLRKPVSPELGQFLAEHQSKLV